MDELSVDVTSLRVEVACRIERHGRVVARRRVRGPVVVSESNAVGSSVLRPSFELDRLAGRRTDVRPLITVPVDQCRVSGVGPAVVALPLPGQCDDALVALVVGTRDVERQLAVRGPIRRLPAEPATAGERGRTGGREDSPTTGGRSFHSCAFSNQDKRISLRMERRGRSDSARRGVVTHDFCGWGGKRVPTNDLEGL